MTAPTYTSPADEDFFASIGRLAISWAQIECGLDLTILSLHYSLGGRHIQHKTPWGLKEKLKYIRKSFGRIDALKPAMPGIEALIAEIEVASEFRHDVIHGFALEHLEGADEAKMVRLLHGRETAQKRFSVSTSKILSEAVAASKIAGRTLKLAVNLQEIIKAASEMPD